MAVQLNHTIVWCRDQRRSSDYFAEILGLPAPGKFAHFDVVDLDNDLSLDFAETEQEITEQHYAFLVTEDEFDEILGRITDRSIDYWAGPGRQKARETNTYDGGRGVYFPDPDGNLLEIITRPYGSGGT